MLGVIDTQGKLVSLVTRDAYIGLEELREMSSQIKRKFGRRKVYLFMDNLRLHRVKAFVELADRNGQELLYNAIYSSELNPIERLWAFAKRDFGRALIGDLDMGSQEEIRALVVKCLIYVPQDRLRKYVIHCLIRMMEKVYNLKHNPPVQQSMRNEEMEETKSPKKGRSASRTPAKDKKQQ